MNRAPGTRRSAETLNRVSTTVNRFRDEYMISTLASLLARGERTFAVVGATHAVMQEPALRSLFGPPLPPDQ